jgi:hypothetical protein
MKALVPGLCLGFLFFTASAQKPPIKFGDVPMENLTMKSYPKDTSASAVVLADYGESTIFYQQNVGFSLSFERIKRIKILKKDGLEWANLTIALYKSGNTDEKLTGLKGITYNLENGKVVESKLKNDGIFKENYDANTDLMKVTCPNVREGSVVEISYKVNSEFLSNFQDWDFQTSIPIILSEYRARIPDFFHYDKYMQGYVSLTVADESMAPASIVINGFERSGGGLRSSVQSEATSDKIDFREARYRWVATEVPAFRPEPFMTSLSNYVSRINFELSFVQFPNQPMKRYMGSWKDINDTFSDNPDFGGEVTGNGFLKKTVEEVTAGVATDEEKIVAISNYVKQNMLWDGNQRRYPVSPLRKVFESKKGNSAEINLLLASMLEKANISVRPVLLSTRDHGFLREGIPVSTQFNYVICVAKVKDKAFLLDGTEKLLPSGMLPERCLNGLGLAISKEGFEWVPLNPKFKTRVVTSADLTLSTNGELAGKLKIDGNGYAALRKRKKYLLDGEKEYLKNFIGSHLWEIKTSEIQNAKDIQNNFIETHDLVVNENMTSAGEIIYLDPFISNAIRANPFKSEQREYPVDFGSPSEETFLFKLTLPENYSVDEIPKSKVMILPENGAKYIYNVVQNGNQVSITSMFQINKSLFSQTEYPHLREFYNQMMAKQAEQIVLRRK